MAADEDKALIWSTVGESRGLWAFPNDGKQPTRINQTISGPSDGYKSFSLLQEFNGQALFKTGDQLWQHDGNDSTLIASRTSGPHRIIGDHLYFFRSDEADRKIELWLTDGSDEGLVQVSGADDVFNDPRRLIVLNGRLYFIAEDSDQNSRLWTVDEVNSRVASASGEVFVNPHTTVGHRWKTLL